MTRSRKNQNALGSSLATTPSAFPITNSPQERNRLHA